MQQETQMIRQSSFMLCIEAGRIIEKCNAQSFYLAGQNGPRLIVDTNSAAWFSPHFSRLKLFVGSSSEGVLCRNTRSYSTLGLFFTLKRS